MESAFCAILPANIYPKVSKLQKWTKIKNAPVSTVGLQKFTIYKAMLQLFHIPGFDNTKKCK